MSNALLSAPLASSPACGAAAASGATGASPGRDVAQAEVEVSIVMPCLNEADTVGTCVAKALRALREAGMHGEVIVADNGSTDGSQAIAAGLGARVVDVPAKGYGSALMGGIAAARGRYVVMGDADDSYDFLEAPKFVRKLREGLDLVQGCRLPAGGGTVRPGAMPLLHRWWGNPMFSLLSRWWFHAPIHDVYCGMRGFTRSWYDSLHQRCTGMEFATEMIIKSVRHLGHVAEVPITLHPDGRRAHPPHLKTFRDGWRTLRFFLICSPRWLFLEPGKWLILFGMLATVLGLAGARFGTVGFGLNTLVFGSLAVLCGSQAVLFALGAKAFAIREGLMPPDARMDRFLRRFRLERGALVALAACCAGAALLAVPLYHWWRAGFGPMEFEATARWVLAGALSAAWGVQTLFASFFLGILTLPRK